MRSGTTLLELTVVLVLIALAGTVILPAARRQADRADFDCETAGRYSGRRAQPYSLSGLQRSCGTRFGFLPAHGFIRCDLTRRWISLPWL